MIVQTVDFSIFVDAFAEYNRKDRFTHEALRALFDYLEDISENMGEDTKLDVIAICCDFTEYASATEAASEYLQFEGMTFDAEGNELETADQVEAKALAFLEDRTTVLKTSSSNIVIQNF